MGEFPRFLSWSSRSYLPRYRPTLTTTKSGIGYRAFRVVACNAEKMTNKNLTISGVDGYPDTVYVPSKSEPELFHWRGKHWMTISKDKEGASSLRPQVWSRNRSVLDEFGQEARTFYRKSPQPPPTRDYEWVRVAFCNHTVRSSYLGRNFSSSGTSTKVTY